MAPVLVLTQQVTGADFVGIVAQKQARVGVGLEFAARTPQRRAQDHGVDLVRSQVRAQNLDLDRIGGGIDRNHASL